MPKNKKRSKIKDVRQFTGLSNLTGFGGNERSSLDDCMAEMLSQGPNQRQSSLNNSDRSRIGGDSDQKANQSGRGKTKHPSWIQQTRNIQTSSKTATSTEDAENWNQNFQMWVNGGTYTPGLLPNIDQEITRNFKVKELSSLLLKNELVARKDLRMPIFERWLLDSKHEEESRGVAGDSILPLRSSSDSEASQRLMLELTSNQNGVDKEDAEKIVAKLCRTTNLACQELLSQENRYRSQSPLNKGDRIYMMMKSPSTNNIVTIEYSRKRWKKPFCFKINHYHYRKLKERFNFIHPNLSFGVDERGKTSLEAKIERSFHILVLALLLRYSALSGGGLLDDLRGGGMQGAIHSSVFEVLQTHFSNVSRSASSASRNNFWFEGFASPFNANLPRFASAFPDLDWHFGSVGRFLDCRFDGEVDDHGNSDEYCEANPPFSPGIMLTMANHMIKALERAEENKSGLTFVVIVPSIQNLHKKKFRSMSSSDTNSNIPVAKHAAEKSFHNMTSSVYCTKHIRLLAREHGYVEGAQHLRPTMYKQSSYDTSIIILQSPDACGKNKTDLQELEKNLRFAFTSRHEMEQIERKRKSCAIP